MPSPAAEPDPSVCYRHSDRTSWTLCERCGRTICPECQILTPRGVRCPDCVREAGGSVRWEPAATTRPARSRAPRTVKRGMRPPAPAERLAQRVDASNRPAITIAIAATALVLWLVGLATANLPYDLGVVYPAVAPQVWRFATASLVYPAAGGAAGVVATLLSIAIFVLISWGAERQFGWRRFTVLVAVSGVGAAAFATLAGSGMAGLTGAIWGIAGAFVIAVWNHPAARTRLLITLGIWFLISLFLGGNLLAIIGGLACGIGAELLLRHHADRSGAPASRPYLIMAAGVGGLIVLAVLRGLLFG